MDRKIIDLTGQRFGKLVVEGIEPNRGKWGAISWRCVCECGNRTIVRGDNLRGNITKSCGCLQSELAATSIRLSRESGGLKNYVESDTIEKGTRLSVIGNKKNIRSNKSGVKGVSLDKRSNKWVATLDLKGERVLRKSFKNKQDAINARKEAEEKYFKPILEKYEKKKGEYIRLAEEVMNDYLAELKDVNNEDLLGVVGMFLDDCCQINYKENEGTQSSVLFGAYKEYINDNDIKTAIKTNHAFSNQLIKKFERVRRSEGRFFPHIILNAQK